MAQITNRKAAFDFEILDRFSAGVELFGHEVKSLRTGQAKLQGARVVVRGGEAYVIGVSIPPYQRANTPPTYDPERPRRLLLTHKEIGQIAGAEGQAGLTCIPLKWHNNGRTLKLEIAIARGKKKQDKRQSIKKRETDREIDRALKRNKA